MSAEEGFRCYVCEAQLTNELNLSGLIPVCCGTASPVPKRHSDAEKAAAIRKLSPTDPRVLANEALRDRIAALTPER